MMNGYHTLEKEKNSNFSINRVFVFCRTHTQIGGIRFATELRQEIHCTPCATVSLTTLSSAAAHTVREGEGCAAREGETPYKWNNNNDPFSTTTT